jgi:hypothetical protein
MSSAEAMTTTMAEPAKPTKNITSSKRMLKRTKDMEEVYRGLAVRGAGQSMAFDEMRRFQSLEFKMVDSHS